MSRSAGFIFSFVVMLGLYAGIHYYFWNRLVRATSLPGPWPATLSTLLVGLAISVPIAFLVARFLNLPGADALMWPAFAWTGMSLFLLLGLLSIDAVHILVAGGFKLAGSEVLVDPERRLWFSRLLAGGAAASSAVLGGYSIQRALAGPKLKTQELALPRWPRSLDGLRIAQLSDLHIGRTIGRSYVEDVVRRTNALEPDLIVITGDLVDGTPENLDHAAAPIGELRARLGVFFVTGNHDHYSGVEPWIAWLRQRGITVLRNQHVTLGEGEAAFDLAGVDDRYFSSDLDRALAGRDTRKPVVLLSHQPQEFSAAVAQGVDLQLSGHTHGGQIFPFTLFAGWIFRWVAGPYRVRDSQLYVSRGSGYVGPPMRLGAPSEIAELTLRSTDADSTAVPAMS